MASAITLIQPTGELWKRIRVELKENVATRDQDLQHIKDWLRKEPHLPNEWAESEDVRLMSFLRGCSFSLEKCKRKLDMYFTMRSAVPEFFSNRDIMRPELQDLAAKAQAPVLPGLTPEGRRVTVCRGMDKSLDVHQLNDAFKMILMVGDIRLAEEVEGIAGDVYVLDSSIVAPSHLGKVSPTMIKKFLICVQEAYPVKLKEVHVVNVSPLIDAIINLVRPFLKEKIRNRIYIHKELNTLYNYVPKDMLPDEYGGNSGPIAVLNQAWLKKQEMYRDWFLNQESIKAIEALRPGKPTNYDELFGIDGSFRKLSID